MHFDIISLFPEMFDALSRQGVAGRGCQRGLWSLKVWNPRDYTHDVHRTVDDRPYGGGPGMVMMAEPLEQAVHAAIAQRCAVPQGDGCNMPATNTSGTNVSATSVPVTSVPASNVSASNVSASNVSASSTSAAHTPVILLSPTGAAFSQARAKQLCDTDGAILVCGRYEGIDQRFIDRCITEEISLGDFVMSGGEIAAMAIMDSAVRLLDGVLNDSQSAIQDSFNTGVTGLLDSPHYTRPEQYHDQTVPAELLSGHHANIAVWRRRQSLLLTARRRPDLISAARARGLLSGQDEQFLRDLEGKKE